MKYGLLIGATIAAYTVWDKVAVSTFGIKPWYYLYFSLPSQALVLLPFAGIKRKKIASTWKKFKREAFVIALLSPLAYTLVLVAMVFSPISRIAPAREVSLLIGVILAGHFFQEKDIRSRVLAAGCMFIGILFLALG